MGPLIKMNIFRYASEEDFPGEAAGHGAGPEEGTGQGIYQDICGMCGRTILTGEKTELFTAPNSGKPVCVCSHCRTAARTAGLKETGSSP